MLELRPETEDELSTQGREGAFQTEGIANTLWQEGQRSKNLFCFKLTVFAIYMCNTDSDS